MSALFNERRAAQAAAFLLFRGGGRLPLVKLLKLMYLAERLSLQRYGEPLTGDSLVSMDHGPVLSMTLNHINGAAHSVDGGWDTWISDRANHAVALRDQSMIRSPEQDLGVLSETDLEVLGETWEKFGHLNQWDLVDYLHENCGEWEDPEGSSKPITYRRLFEHLGFNNEQVDALVERLAQQRRLNSDLS